jgi:hypothetical protein
MDLEKEMLRLRAATDDWAKALLVRRQERLIQELERDGPCTPAALALLTTLHDAHTAMQDYRRHLLEATERTVSR